jgi:hypothetical protein
MYRILIDSKVKNCAIEFAKAVLKAKSYTTDLKHFKNNLTCRTDKVFEKKAKDYVQLILDSYKKKKISTSNLSLLDSILCEKSSSFTSYIKQFETIIPQAELSTTIQYTNSNGKCYDDVFWKVLVEVMDYGNFKSTYYECIEKIGIDTCVYCNMSPADKCDSNFANYQMEHFYPKNSYPFLSTSFFNFFPSCGTCNQKKGKIFDSNGFDLYRERKSDIDDPFMFTTHNAICYYEKLNRNQALFQEEKNVKVIFSSPTKYAEKQIKKLQIQERYNCRRIRRKIFELLFKYERNAKTQIKVTQRTFSKLKSLKVDKIYDVFGSYSKKEDIHKEQLTKFSIDFGKETGML